MKFETCLVLVSSPAALEHTSKDEALVVVFLVAVQMLLEVASTRKCLVAEVAFVRFFSCVSSFVTV